MNAVEIEEAINHPAEKPFDREEFAFQFLEAFGNKATTIKRLKNGLTNSSDIEDRVLQRNNIHIAVCAEGEVGRLQESLKAVPQLASRRPGLSSQPTASRWIPGT